MLELKSMQEFPAGNPFHYDAISVGQSLEMIGLPNVFVMDSGTLGEGLYIVNSTNGQRAKIEGVIENAA